MYHTPARLPPADSALGVLVCVTSSFEDKFKTSKAAFQQVGLEQHVKMAKEEADMRRSLLLVTTETNKHCITLVTDYRTQAKRVRAHRSCLNHSSTHPLILLLRWRAPDNQRLAHERGPRPCTARGAAQVQQGACHRAAHQGNGLCRASRGTQAMSDAVATRSTRGASPPNSSHCHNNNNNNNTTSTGAAGHL